MTSERRYEIAILCGPCTEAEADALCEDIADLAFPRLGSSVSMRPWDEAADDQGECLCGEINARHCPRHNEAADDRQAALAEALTRAAFISGHLLDMIPREVWRDQGGDDGQGHYEGEYYAAGIAEEIREWARLAATERTHG